MRAPVIEQLRHMNHTSGLRGQPQDHVVILTAVEFRAEQGHTFQQFSVKSAEMTDVIIRPQIIRRKIRFKMQGDHVVDGLIALKSRLITVNIIGSLFTDHLHILIKHTGMQHIVVVKQGNVITGSHIQTGIGIAGNPLVLNQFPISYPCIFRRIFLTDLPYLIMFCVGTVRQAQLPSRIRLSRYRLHGLP